MSAVEKIVDELLVKCCLDSRNDKGWFLFDDKNNLIESDIPLLREHMLTMFKPEKFVDDIIQALIARAAPKNKLSEANS